jgi:hypothetical protein
MLRYLRRAKLYESRDGKHIRPAKHHLSAELYHAAIASLTVGSIVQGILAICGRPNSLTVVYLIAAAVLLAASAVAKFTVRTEISEHPAAPERS